ncbi:unnamed protein product [Clonostachys rosea]|uniref:Uncharacterized protein n=1 Tax=Bionectria ochroleuca TaxID=29856 RepID=A0ABY6UFI5_BIOOC|nr:unnamed protein product [Clonostachys rosea]
MFGQLKPNKSAQTQGKVTTEDEPPSYTPPRTHQVLWDFQCLESVRARQEGSPNEAKIGEFLPGKFGGGKINFIFTSNPASVKESWWEANVDISVKSLPESMRQGWSWSKNNIDRAGGQLIIKTSELPQYHQTTGWCCGRRYKLVDEGEDPQWEAVVWIYAKDLPSLSCVKVDRLIPDNVYLTWATNGNKRLAYTRDWAICPCFSLAHLNLYRARPALAGHNPAVEPLRRRVEVPRPAKFSLALTNGAREPDMEFALVSGNDGQPS